jgi:nucleotide-binding universal stress UspA family protein
MGTAPRGGPVVVEIDGSPESPRVIEYASIEAQRTGAGLLLVRPYLAHTTFSPMTPQYERGDPHTVAEADLEAAVEQVHRQVGFGITVTTAAREGARLRVLARAARSARLVVVGRHRAKGPHRVVTAQRDLNLAAMVACPLVVVPTGWRATTADRAVYVGVDGSGLSTDAVGFAFATASGRRGHLVVVHSDSGPVRKVVQDDGVAWATSARLTVAETLAGWTERYPDVKVTRLVTGRTATDALVGASPHAGLIVVGAYAGRLPHDPVTRHVLAAASCPVAVVKHQPTSGERRRARSAGTDVVVPAY